MQKVGKIIFVISIVINLILGFILIDKRNMSSNSNLSFYVNKIDSLELELYYIQQNRDSVRSLIDTVFIEIANNEEHYEKIRDTILTNSITEDYVFFTKYLEQNRERFSSIYNP